MQIYKFIKFSLKKKGIMKKILYFLYSLFYLVEYKKSKKDNNYNKDDVYPLF